MTTPTGATPVSGTKMQPVDTRGRASSFYFETRPTRMTVDLDFDGASGYEYVDKIPAGSVVEEFYSRPIDLKNHNRDRISEVERETSPEVEPAKPTVEKNIGTMLMIRKVPVKVEPKVMFANERTFLFWMHSSLWLFGASLTILRYSHGQTLRIYYGGFTLCVGVLFIVYAIHQYRRRTNMLHNKDPGPYEDLLGPIVLAVLLMITILIEFCFRLLQFAW